jgi:hypothetical protein
LAYIYTHCHYNFCRYTALILDDELIILNVFFLTKKGPEGPGVAALNIVGGITTYKEDLSIKVNYKQVLQKCKKDPRSKDENDHLC